MASTYHIHTYMYVYTMHQRYSKRGRACTEKPIITFALGRQFIYGGIVSRQVAPSTDISGTLKPPYNLDGSAISDAADAREDASVGSISGAHVSISLGCWGINAQVIFTSYGSRSFLKARINSSDKRTKQKFLAYKRIYTCVIDDSWIDCDNDDLYSIKTFTKFT